MSSAPEWPRVELVLDRDGWISLTANGQTLARVDANLALARGRVELALPVFAHAEVYLGTRCGPETAGGRVPSREVGP